MYFIIRDNYSTYTGGGSWEKESNIVRLMPSQEMIRVWWLKGQEVKFEGVSEYLI